MNYRGFPRFRALALTTVAILACGGGDDGGAGDVDATALSPACEEAQDVSDLAWIQDNVFTPSCASFSVCHQGAAGSARGLNLEAGMAEANLVGQPSSAHPTETLVVPGDPQSSYLMVALGSYDGPQLDVGTMPPNNPVLCVQKREAIERWIQGLPTP